MSPRELDEVSYMTMVGNIRWLAQEERKTYWLHKPISPRLIKSTQLCMFDPADVTYWHDPLDAVREWFLKQWFETRWSDGWMPSWLGGVPTSIHHFVMVRIRRLVEMERDAVLFLMNTCSIQSCSKPVRASVSQEQFHLRPIGVHSVYFALDRDSGEIKIGTSKKVRSRMKNVARETKRSIVVMATVDGDREVEQSLHRRFRHARIRGEWFRPVPELLDYIDSIKPSEDGVVSCKGEGVR